MPFKSMRQMRFMFANEPEIAKEWSRKYGTPQDEARKQKTKEKAVLYGLKRAKPLK